MLGLGEICLEQNWKLRIQYRFIVFSAFFFAILLTTGRMPVNGALLSECGSKAVFVTAKMMLLLTSITEFTTSALVLAI